MYVAIVCCGRLENRYAIEFVEHYKKLNFDHIYICDNNHDGEEYFEDVLQQYIDDQFITILDYRNDESIQCYAYLEVYEQLSDKYDWLFFCDFDEYLYLDETNDVKEFLSNNRYINKNQILVHWKLYTDNNLIYDDGRTLKERFTITNLEHSHNRLVKPFIKTKLKYLRMSNPHVFHSGLLLSTTCDTEGNRIYIYDYCRRHMSAFDIEYKYAHIKHYLTKTIDEYTQIKLKRGTADKSYEQFFEDEDYRLFFEINEITEDKLKYLKEHNIIYKNFIKNQ